MPEVQAPGALLAQPGEIVIGYLHKQETAGRDQPKTEDLQPLAQDMPVERVHRCR